MYACVVLMLFAQTLSFCYHVMPLLSILYFLYVQFYVDIFVGFESSSYTIKEDAGTFSPALTLDRPSPCCITVLTKLTRVTGELFIL